MVVWYDISILKERKQDINMDNLLDNAQELRDLLDNGGRLNDGGKIEELVLDIAQQVINLLDN